MNCNILPSSTWFSHAKSYRISFWKFTIVTPPIWVGTGHLLSSRCKSMQLHQAAHKVKVDLHIHKHASTSHSTPLVLLFIWIANSQCIYNNTVVLRQFNPPNANVLTLIHKRTGKKNRKTFHVRAECPCPAPGPVAVPLYSLILWSRCFTVIPNFHGIYENKLATKCHVTFGAFVFARSVRTRSREIISCYYTYVF